MRATRTRVLPEHQWLLDRTEPPAALVPATADTPYATSTTPAAITAPADNPRHRGCTTSALHAASEDGGGGRNERGLRDPAPFGTANG